MMNNNDNTPNHETDFKTFRDQLTDDAVDKVLRILWESKTLFIENDKIMIKETVCVETPVETQETSIENTVPADTCPICYDETTEMIMCNGHASVCLTCAPNLMEDKRCPICRESISDQLFQVWRDGALVLPDPHARRPPFQDGVVYDGRTPYISFWNNEDRTWDSGDKLYYTGITRCTFTFTMGDSPDGIVKIRKNKQWWVDLDRYGSQVFSHRIFGKIKIYLEVNQ